MYIRNIPLLVDAFYQLVVLPRLFSRDCSCAGFSIKIISVINISWFILSTRPLSTWNKWELGETDCSSSKLKRMLRCLTILKTMRLFVNFYQLFRKYVNLVTMGKGKMSEVNKAADSWCNVGNSFLDSSFSILRRGGW